MFLSRMQVRQGAEHFFRLCLAITSAPHAERQTRVINLSKVQCTFCCDIITTSLKVTVGMIKCSSSTVWETDDSLNKAIK